ncbi:MAG TPA: hypothetical protein PLD37_06185 [Usitatibacteraceae bacterium]|nr:hypothetical protein [Usitatibacteraceae bacterium]
MNADATPMNADYSWRVIDAGIGSTDACGPRCPGLESDRRPSAFIGAPKILGH